MRVPRTTTLGGKATSGPSSSTHGAKEGKNGGFPKESGGGLAGALASYDQRLSNKASGSSFGGLSRSPGGYAHVGQDGNRGQPRRDLSSQSTLPDGSYRGSDPRGRGEGGRGGGGYKKSHAASLSSIRSISDVFKEVSEATRAGLPAGSLESFGQGAAASSERGHLLDSMAGSQSALDDLNFFSRLEFIKHGPDHEKKKKEAAEKEEAERRKREAVFRGSRPNSIARSLAYTRVKGAKSQEDGGDESRRTSMDIGGCDGGGDSRLASALGQTPLPSGRRNPSPQQTPSGYFSSSSSLGSADDEDASPSSPKGKSRLTKSLATMESSISEEEEEGGEEEDRRQSEDFTESDLDSVSRSTGIQARWESSNPGRKPGSHVSQRYSTEPSSSLAGEFQPILQQPEEDHDVTEGQPRRAAQHSRAAARDATPGEAGELSPFRRREVCRPLSKTEVLDMLYTIYTPRACALKVRQSRWIRPLVGEDEAWGMLDDKILQQTDFRTCLKLVIQAKMEREGVISLPSELRLAVEDVRDPDEALKKVENYLATRPRLTAQ